MGNAAMDFHRDICFRDDMDLFGKVLAAAKRDRRKPDMQVMATLEACL